MYDVDDSVWGLLDKLNLEEEVDNHDKEKTNGSKCNHQASTIILTCQYCSSTNVSLEEGNYICKKCFSIVSRFIDNSPEWRYYGPEDSRGADPTRCGPPCNNLISPLGSMIGSNGKDTHSMRMIQKYQFWNSMTYRERSLYTIFDQITTNAVSNGIPVCIIEEAKVLYKRLTDNKVSRGENRQALIASSVYMSCKSNNVPRSVKEIANMFNIKVTSMTKGCKLFQQLMINSNVKSSAPEDFVSRFCSKLGLDTGITQLCRYIVKKVDELCVVCESTPPSIVAGSVQLCNIELCLGITRTQMAEACHISQVTIAKCYKRMNEHKDKLMPPDVHAFLVEVRERGL